jgi:hypothetical protein
VPDEKPWVIITRRAATHSNPPVPYPCLALLETCRQIFYESWHLFYQLNTLCLLSASSLFCFLDDIGTARRNQIVSIRCNFDLAAFHHPRIGNGLPNSARRKLRMCTRLKALHFVIDDKPYGHARRPFRRFGGLQSVGIERNGGGDFEFVEHRVVAYVKSLTRPRIVKPPETVNLFEGLKRRGKDWDAEWDCGVEALKELWALPEEELTRGRTPSRAHSHNRQDNSRPRTA